MASKIEEIIVKYLTESATAEDLDILSTWLEDPNSLALFKNYVTVHYAIDYNVNDSETEKNVKRLLSRIRKENTFSRRKRYYLYVAAIFIPLFFLLYFLKDTAYSSTNQLDIVNISSSSINPGSQKAILTLEDGNIITLGDSSTKAYKNKNFMSRGKELVYKKDVSNKKGKINYNFLEIPRGGEFFVELSDGTKVWLNSESQLKYPVTFTKGSKRKVELVYGEAYFDVSPSSNHNGAKFIVTTKNQDIEVIGTEFNIKAYNDENIIYTTLVEGNINIEVNSSKEVLKPNQQLVLNKINNDFIITQVDTYSETAWRKGLFSFKNKSLKDIMKVMSRWYDVDVVFENKTLEHIEFKGVISKNQNIEDILTLIKNTNFINAYDIKNNTILLK